MFEKIRNRKIKIAVLGCGRISKNHFESIKLHSDDLELTAICDTDRSILESFDWPESIAKYTEFHTLLEETDVDLVSLCTPSGFHPSQTILAARYGVNVMTEKPMATRWKDGLAMVKACDEANVRLFVIKQNRRNSTLQLLKRWPH